MKHFGKNRMTKFVFKPFKKERGDGVSEYGF